MTSGPRYEPASPGLREARRIYQAHDTGRPVKLQADPPKPKAEIPGQLSLVDDA